MGASHPDGVVAFARADQTLGGGPYARNADGSLKGFYLVTGRYDMVAVVEVPDEETAAIKQATA